jgi:hypothetical protein
VKPFSSSTLKITAIITMVIDHVGTLFFPEQMAWRIIGRLSFPLFAFLIAEGYKKTSNAEKYFFRLLIFAVISQLPFVMVMRAVGVLGFPLNIFLTLSVGLLALLACKRLPAVYSLPFIIFLCAVAEFLNMDYGAYGILTIMASYVFLSGRRIFGAALLLLLPAIEPIVYYLVGGFFYIQFFALMSVPFIFLYNGALGLKLPRRLFYWFYPAHLALLWLIWFLLNLAK